MLFSDVRHGVLFLFGANPAMRSFTHLLAAICLCTAAACSAGEGGALLTELSERAAAPRFDLKGPGGERIRLSDFRGKPLIVNFWATWCPPCRAEMPSIQRAWEQLEENGVGVVAINVGEDPETVREFVRQVPVTFPLPIDKDSRVVQSWPVKGLPTTFVVDSKGRLVYVAAGERQWDDPALLDLVRRLK
jgi:peroxiredoxin